jgi:hypothetical protein
MAYERASRGGSVTARVECLPPVDATATTPGGTAHG